MHKCIIFLLALLIAAGTTACADRDTVAGGIAPPTAVAIAAAADASGEAVLRMSIDGQAWHADHAIDAMVKPPGLDRAVLINGSLGPKNANEQAFSIILIGVDGPGPRHLVSSDPASGVIQLGNLSSSRYLAGSLLGYDVNVDVVRYSAQPVLVEVRFSGRLSASDGNTLAITDGYFLYAE